MGYYIKMYMVTFIVFFIIDLIWLGVISKNFYASQIGFLMKTNINWVAAISFYMLFIVGILFFVLDPALSKDSWKFALFAGGFFGFITYATYDLTNLATLKNWPLMVTAVDLVWGTFLVGATSTVSFFIIKSIS